MQAPVQYRLIRTIARGGMGEVYEAEARDATGRTRRVALKRSLLPANEAATSTLSDEARLTRRMAHPSIVEVLDHGLLDGHEFLVLEFVDGLDLRRAVERGGLPPAPAALFVASRIARALEHVQGARDARGSDLGLIHRDVTPHNVLIAFNGEVKLADFGIALGEDRQHITETGLVKGKRSYMAPEQLEGRRLTAATDVYGLGGTLHFMLTGEPPGQAPDLDRTLEPAVVTILQTALHSDPAERVEAGQLASALEGLVELEGGAARARTELQGWLRGLVAPIRAPNPLDDLLGFCVVADVDSGPRRYTVTRPAEAALADGDSGPRRYTVTRPAEAALADAPGRAEGVDATVLLPDPGVRRDNAPSRRPWVWASMAAAAVGVAVGIGTCVPSRPEPSRPESSRPEPSRPESSRPEPSRLDAPRPDAPRQEPSRLDAPRPDAPRQEPSRLDAPRPDAPRQEPSRLDAPRPDAPRQEPSRLDAPRPEPTGPEPPASSATVHAGLEDAASAPPPTTAEPAALVSAPGDAGATRDSVPRRRGPRRAVPGAPPVSAPRSAEPADAGVAAAPTEHGWIRIGGRALAGQTRALMNGRPIGYPPLLVRVPTGDHELVIRNLSDGRKVVEQTITVRAGHTRGSALKVLR